MAKPACSHRNMTISSRLLNRKSEICSQLTGSPPKPVTMPLSRPIWFCVGGLAA